MAERSRDWLAQAERDLEEARWSLQGGFYEWACFIAQQAAEKAVKALYQALHGDAWGHSVSALLRALPEGHRPDPELVEAATRLDRLYIPPRCPNSFVSGSPKDYFTQKDAEAALDDAERSSNTVRVRFLGGRAAIKGLKAIARRLLKSHTQVERVILFGSLARGDYAPGSDADLLIVLERDDRPFLERMPIFLREFLEAPVPVEVFPYTRAELEAMRATGNRFIERALRAGVTLAERSALSPAPQPVG